jgi:hypothetical protein
VEKLLLCGGGDERQCAYSPALATWICPQSHQQLGTDSEWANIFYLYHSCYLCMNCLGDIFADNIFILCHFFSWRKWNYFTTGMFAGFDLVSLFKGAF